MWRIAALLLFVTLGPQVRAETLQATLRAQGVPLDKFAPSELTQTVWASAARGDPFLLAYYVDDGLGRVQKPLRVVRYRRTTQDLRRAQVQQAEARWGVERVDCLGRAQGQIEEIQGLIYIGTSLSPSAGCTLVFSSRLELRAALYGWSLGTIGADYLVVHESQRHFAPIHPLVIQIYNLKSGKLTEVYPPAEDPFRAQFSRALAAHMPQWQWCAENNIPCDPKEFDSVIVGKVIVNEQAQVFGLEVEYYATNFGDEAEESVAPQLVEYIYRLKGEQWEHRQFSRDQIASWFGVASVDEMVRLKPNAAFAAPPRRPPSKNQ